MTDFDIYIEGEIKRQKELDDYMQETMERDFPVLVLKNQKEMISLLKEIKEELMYLNHITEKIRAGY